MSSRTTGFEQKTAEDSRSSQGTRQEEASQITEELEAILPGDLQEALLTFDGDFRGPWLALRLEADANLRSDEIRRAYRQAVRSEHPDTSDFPNADERFERVRQAYAILKDDGSRELLLEAIAQDASSFNELSSMEAFSEQSGKRTTSLRELLVGVGFVALAGFVAILIRLSSNSEMKIRSAKAAKALVIVNAKTSDVPAEVARS